MMIAERIELSREITGLRAQVQNMRQAMAHIDRHLYELQKVI